MTNDAFDDKKIIPQAADNDTRLFTTIKRIQDRLPSLDGKAGKILQVSADEHGCEWVSGGGGGPVSFADITGAPADNAALKTELDSKVPKNAGSPDFTIGVDGDGQLFVEIQ